MTRFRLVVRSALIWGTALTAPGAADPLAKTLFSAETMPSRQNAAPLGGYAGGCLAGAARLPESGPTWQAMRLSRNRSWGHPVLVDFIRDISAFAARQPGWSGLYIGDMSQPRGGPMPGDHRSHQIGLDADIWMLPAARMNLSRPMREQISSASMRRAGGAYVNDDWSRAHMRILRAAASGDRVARIFLFPGAKVQMCNDAKGDRSWLRKIRPWWGHYTHFHVRLKCPEETPGCVDQALPPPGDGCAEAREWVDDILNPPPPGPDAPNPKPRRELRLADLPKQCASVLRSN